MATFSIKNSRLKKPTQSKTNILTLYSPRSFYIEKADTKTIDTEIVLDLPEKATDFLISKFKGQKIDNCWTKNSKTVANSVERNLF